MDSGRPDTADVDFTRIYRDHAAGLHRFALYLCGDSFLADELVSEAFVRVWTARERVDLTTVRGYLCAIVRNLFLHDLRRVRRQTPLPRELATDLPSPERSAGAQERLRLVLAALRSLPETDRAAVLLRADQNLAYDEIAAVLEISASAAKVKVHRARLKLAEALDGTGRKEAM
jgi:RNA polymerase sigma-70 factor (ECF subfamily)